MKWLILVVLAVGVIPAVYAEVGYDYTIIDNEDGTTTWTSHEPYYFDGAVFVPYQLTQDDNIIQVQHEKTKFVFDKNACAVSVFDGSGIIVDSDSYVVRTAILDTDDWSNLSVNDLSCDTVLTELDDTVTINFLKQNDEGLLDIEYVLTPNNMKTTAKFTNQLYENNKFAFTETLHLPNDIVLNDQTINLSEFTGQTFTRETLEENKDLIIQAKEIVYGSGLGFDNLWAVSVHDGNRISLDYANVEQTQTAIGETVELDPTYSAGFTSEYMTYTGNHLSSDCDENTSNWNTGLTSYWNMYKERGVGTAGWCVFPSFKFNISSMPSSAIVSQVDFGLNLSLVSGAENCQLNQMQTDPATTYQTVSPTRPHVADILDGNSYASNDSFCTTTGSKTVTLSSSANTDLQNQISSGWFGVGMYYESTARDGNVHRVTYGSPTLTVTYSTPTIPDAITDLSATYNNPNVDLSWTLPSSGGSAITSFKVYRDSGSGFSLYDTVTSSSATSYQDTNPVTGATNFYKVNAVNSVGEASDSNSASTFVGVPPDAPTGVSTSIADADAAPLTITVSFTSPSNVGTGTLTGFEIYRDSTLITTTGLVTTYDDTVSSSGTYVYKVRAVSTHGTSGDSNTSSITTPTAPNAINDLTGQADSNVQTSISWTAPSTGGSNIVQYKLFRDSINIANTTSTSYTDTGLTQNTSYLYNVFSQNNVGTSTKSNDLSLTTYTGVTGSISGTATTIGATTKIDVTPNVTAGTPTPTFNTFIVKEGTATITTFTGTTGYVHHTDDSSHTYTIESTDSTHWQNPTITGTLSGVQASYNPSWSNNLSYNYTRSTNSFDLIVNRDITPGWDLTCEYRTAAQASGNQTGTTGTGTNMYAFQDSQTISDGKHVYVTCEENNAIVLSFVSYGPNLITGGLQLLDTHFGDFLGAPAVLFFVILAAGMFTGRSANTGILVVLSIIGVLGFIGMVTIDEASWGFILIAGVLGLFVGKRFL